MKFDYMKYYLSSNSNLSIYEEVFFKADILFISNWYCTIRFDYKTRKDTLPFLELYLLEIMLHKFRNNWK